MKDSWFLLSYINFSFEGQQTKIKVWNSSFFQKCDECGSRWLLGWPTASAHLDMSTCLSSACSFIIFCTSSLIIMPVKYMREIMENFQAFCNQTSLHGWQYITQRPETDGFWAGTKCNAIVFQSVQWFYYSIYKVSQKKCSSSSAVAAGY